jgi:hypothetical protein
MCLVSSRTGPPKAKDRPSEVTSAAGVQNVKAAFRSLSKRVANGAV